MRSLILAIFSLLLNVTNSSHALASSSSDTSSVDIAPFDQALTFAKTSKQYGSKTILVTSFQDNIILGRDLSKAFINGERDAIDLFHRYQYDQIQNMLNDEQRYPVTRVPSSHLGLPVQLADIHIAVGTNYRDHAQETDVTRTPFLFSKRVTPTPWNAQVSSKSRALDYEAEVAMVVLNKVEYENTPYRVGFMLANDLSDREVLMHHVDPKDIESGKGFAQGKSAPGLLPVGNLFVIPNMSDAFLSRLSLQLSVNNSVRQQAKVKHLIWQRKAIFNEIWKNSGRTWAFNDSQIQLLPEPHTIPERTLILTGTPAGTVFQGIPFMTKMRGVGQWLFSGMEPSLQYHVVERYLSESESNYLKNRDLVTVRAPFLGTLKNTITSPTILETQTISGTTGD